MRIAVFGAGGVGGYFGGRLAQAGEEVIFIARGAHLQAMRAAGLWVESIKWDFRVQPVWACDDPAEVGTVDAVIVAVKAWQVTEAAQAMKPLMGSQTFVVPLENGVEAPEQLAAILGRERVLGGLCRIATFIVEPGHIRHTGIEPYIAFGELDGSASERAERLRAVFANAGVWAEIPADIRTALWEKFVFIAAISGGGAVTRAPAGVLRSIPETRQMLIQAIEEAANVARAHRISLPQEVVQKVMGFIDRLPEGTLASMQRDIGEGRPSELEAQNGAVVRLGRAVGVPTPTHAFLYASLLPQEKRARGEKGF